MDLCPDLNFQGNYTDMFMSENETEIYYVRNVTYEEKMYQGLITNYISVGSHWKHIKHCYFHPESVSAHTG